jgi:parvulin-like peptidyl-prolyl isomerase
MDTNKILEKAERNHYLRVGQTISLIFDSKSHASRSANMNPRIILLTTLLLFSAMVPLTAYGEQTIDKVAAVVNGDVILNSDVDILKNPFVRELLPLDFGVTPAGKWPTENEVLEELIVIKLVEQEALKNGVQIEDKDIELILSNLRRRNKMKKGHFYMLAAANGLNTRQFRNLIRRRSLLTEMIRKEIVTKITLNEREIQEYFKDNRDSIDEQFDELTRRTVRPDAEERLRELLAAVPKERDIFTGGRVKLMQLTVKTPDKNNEAAMEKLREKLRKIHSEMALGADFGKLAQRYSTDTYASQGGSIGWMNTSEMIPNLRKLVSQLPVGKMSDPIQTPDSLILFYLADAKGRKKKTVPIPESEQQAMKDQIKKQFERLKQQSQQRGPENGDSASEPGTPTREAQDLGVLNPDEKAEFEKKWTKIEAIVRSKKIRERTKEWIEELKETAVIKNMI